MHGAAGARLDEDRLLQAWLAAVYPIATMVPAGATVAPTTDSAAALPSEAVGSQEVPVPELV